ncbi:MAG: hypothetical protein JWN44_6831 [Myxococcales bacterium]|nr:hypothetical protein [Myxococcales bacterium]
MVEVAADLSCTAEQLFAIVWETMVDVIGTAATATLVRRSSRRISQRNAQIDCVSVNRDGIDFNYTVPEGWRRSGGDALAALQALAHELSPLLVELTGPVLIRRLVASSDLARCHILFEERIS